MCGVFGMLQSNPKESREDSAEILKQLMDFSQNRGQDSSGVATWSNQGIHVIKRPMPAEKLAKTKEFGKFVKNFIKPAQKSDYFLMIGNCRLSTDGDTHQYENSQPFVDEGLVLVHNGLIVNKKEIYSSNTSLNQSYDIDTEVLADLFSYYCKTEKDPRVAIQKTFSELRGTSSSAFFPPGSPGIVLGSNNGSLYYRVSKRGSATSIIFASESYALDTLKLDDSWSESVQIKPNSGLFTGMDNQWSLDALDFSKPQEKKLEIDDKKQPINEIKDGLLIPPHVSTPSANESLLKFNEQQFIETKRCKKCILPESFPFIEFDNEGVCNHCNNYRPLKFKGAEALEKELRQSKTGKPKIIVALSGGRDSCYALHYLVKDLGLDVVAYTYDWGAVTPLARRNMSIMCAELGVEHILVAADIAKKRRNINKNVTAWLKKPNLGAVPLFMAGDKQFFHYAQTVKSQTSGDHLLFGMNPLERTDFKVGFCGIKNEDQDRHYNLNIKKQLQMISWYGKEFLQNPAYLNSSMIDTAFGYWAYYLSNHDYKILYQYIPWIEDDVNKVLLEQYNWETAPDTTTTWRIGDGTASFYNYIYATMAGFTESDTMRSNQIREGHISRDRAMKIMLEENRPRFESIKWYCDSMGLDFNRTIKIINQAKKPQLIGHS